MLPVVSKIDLPYHVFINKSKRIHCGKKYKVSHLYNFELQMINTADSLSKMLEGTYGKLDDGW